MKKNKSLINGVEVHVDCLTSYPNELVNKDDYQHLVNLVESYKQTVEWDKTPKPDYDYYEGRRYHDNERVADVIYGNIRLSINRFLGEKRFSGDAPDTHELFSHYIKLIDILSS